MSRTYHSSVASTTRVDQNELKHLRKIEYVEEGIYRVELQARNGEALTTIARVTGSASPDIKVMPDVVNFDSEEFGRQMMQGLIYSRPICFAVGAFHNACLNLGKV